MQQRVIRVLAALAVALATLTVLPPAPAAAVPAPSFPYERIFLDLKSEPGDPIGRGQDVHVQEPQAIWSSSVDTALGVLTIEAQGTDGTTYSLSFQGSDFQVPSPYNYGGYTNVGLAPATDGSAALSVSIAGRTCRSVTGTFWVVNADYGAPDQPELVHVLFEQYCDGSSAKLEGQIRYERSTERDPVLTLPPAQIYGGGDVIGGCGYRNFPLGSVSGASGGGYQVLASFPGSTAAGIGGGDDVEYQMSGPGEIPTTSRRYTPGSYLVTVSVSDSSGYRTIGTIPVTYLDDGVSLLLSPFGGLAATSGLPFNLQVALFDPVDAGTYAIHVDWGDLLSTDTTSGSCQYIPGLTHTYANFGQYGTIYNASITATAPDGSSDTIDFDVYVDVTGSDTLILVSADAPHVIVNNPVEGQAIYAAKYFGWNAGASSCLIDYGDGAGPQTGTLHLLECDGPIHRWATGEHSVWGSVATTHGTQMSSWSWVTSNVTPSVNPPVVVALDGHGSLTIKESVRAQAAFVDPGATLGETYTCTVDYGDGSEPVRGEVGSSLCTQTYHIYDTPGTYTVTAYVEDSNGAGVSSSSTVTVLAELPTVFVSSPGDQTHATWDSAYYLGYQNWQLGSFEDSAGLGAGPWTVDVDLGDGTIYHDSIAAPGTIPPVGHVFAIGTHVVTVRVTNSAGVSDAVTFTATLTDDGPGIGIPKDPLVVTEGEPGDLFFGIYDPSLDGPWTVTIDYGDGTSTTFQTTALDAPLPEGEHVWVAGDACSPGSSYACHTATVTVTDAVGISRSSTREVAVLDLAPVVTASSPIIVGDQNTAPVKILSFADASTGPWDVFVTDANNPGGFSYHSTVDTPGVVYLPEYRGGPIPHVVLDVYVADRTGLNSKVTVEINPPNTLPVVAAPAFDKAAVEGATVTALATFTDPDAQFGETYVCKVDYGVPWKTGHFVAVTEPGICTGDPITLQPGKYDVTVTVVDNRGGTGTATSTVTVPNVPPSVSQPTLAGPAVEGESMTETATFADPGLDGPFSCTVDYGDGSGAVNGTVNGSTCAGPGHVYGGAGDFTVTVAVTDGNGATGTASGTAPIRNVAPTIISLTSSPARLGTPAMFEVTFSDPGIAERYTVKWAASNGAYGTSYYVAGPGGVTTASGGFNPGEAGIYTVTVTIEDGAGSVTADTEAVVYDPARTLSGKGNVASPAGACTLAPACATAGSATFSVSANYPRNATTPNTSFTFSAAGFKLKSTSGAWLVAGPDGRAVLQGTATVNGAAGYAFRVTAVQGRPDSLRVEVWSPTGTVVYDSGSLLPLASGSISVK